MKKNKLTPKQRKFIVEYMVDLNGEQAAIRAGYSKKTAKVIASHLLTKVNILEEIEKLKKEQEERTLVTADFVILGLKEVAERCMQRHPVMVRDGKDWVQKTELVEHEDGTETEEGVWDFDSTGANRALELLGKHLELFTDNVKHSGEVKLKEYIITDAK